MVLLFRRLSGWFQSLGPEIEDPKERLRILNIMALPILLGALYGHVSPPPDPWYRYAASLGLLLGLWRAARGKFALANLLLPTALALVILESSFAGFGLHDVRLLGLPAAVAAAGLLLGPRGALIFGGLSMLGLVGLYAAEAVGIIVTPWSAMLTPSALVSATLLMAINTVALTLAIWRLSRSLRQSREHADDLRESEARWRSLIVDSPLIVIRIDENRQINFANVDSGPAASLIGSPIDGLFQSQTRLEATNEVDRALRECRSATFDAQMELPGTKPRWYAIHVGPIRVDQKIVGASLVCIDIMERLRARQEREELIGELSQRNAELERYAYTASHELKTPLITIRSFAGVLEKEASLGGSRIQADAAARISAAAERMSGRLDALLKLARLGRIATPTERVSLSVLASEAVDLCSGSLAFRGVAVSVQPGMPEVLVDRVRFIEVFQNLIENAIKFTRNAKRPTIEIGMRGDGAARTFFVTDNGIGIAQRFHETVFGLFEKLDAKSEGSGVGLAVVRRIVEVHGGRIWVESAGPGHGTTFCLTLP